MKPLVLSEWVQSQFQIRKEKYGYQDEIRDFFEPGFHQFHSPFLLPDFLEALECILFHLESDHKILVYGDKDADGVSSSSLLVWFLREKFPTRDIVHLVTTGSEDYGITKDALVKIQSHKPKLVITTDFGTSNHKEISQLKEQGIDVIVIDHHEAPKVKPDCLLVNPKRDDSSYPNRDICTSFIIFKFIIGYFFKKSSEYNQAYSKKIDLFSEEVYQNGIQIKDNPPSVTTPVPNSISDPSPDKLFFYSCQKEGIYSKSLPFIDLAAIGTITDLMPLRGENRALVKLALDKLRTNGTQCIGLKELFKSIEIDLRFISEKDLGWTIGPSLNAAGRMGKTEVAASLLTSSDSMEAKQLCLGLKKLNSERKERTLRNMDRADRYFKKWNEKTKFPILFYYEPDLEPGVSGIVATKLVEQYKKPVFLIAPDCGHGKASVRAFQKENMLSLVERVQEHLIQWGGHEEACGFSISLENISKIETLLYQESHDWKKSKSSSQIQSQPEISLFPKELIKSIWEDTLHFAPFGKDNPPFSIHIKNAKPIDFHFMKEGKHLRFKVIDAFPELQFVVWNQADAFNKLTNATDSLDLFGEWELNVYQGRKKIQFRVDRFIPSEGH
jgi:single-stranded-DNA-specific exonuclease